MAAGIVVVLDTSALLFWTLDAGRLSSSASSAIADAERILVSSISVWEIGVKSSRGRLDIPLPVREFADTLGQINRVEVLPVDTATWLRSVELRWEHRDPADRVIVATADLNACPLVTSDAAMRAFYSQSIW